jgi:hypothetical protein
MSRQLSRRSLLRGAAGVAVALPLLDAMQPREAAAQAAATPLRFGVFFSANGVIDADWTPTGGEKDFVLSTALAPLAPHRSDINIVQGLNAETSYMQQGNPHDLAMAHMLTGMRMQGSSFGRAGHILDGTAGGPSVDQALAKLIGGDTKLRSLELGVQSTITDLEPMVTRMSYGGPNDPRSPLDDPKEVFKRLFGVTAASQAEIDALHKRQKSVLDAVLVEFNAVGATLGYDDKQKLDRHAEAIRDIERQLDLMQMPTQPGCKIPSAPPSVNVDTFYDCTRDGRPNKCLAGFDEIGKAQMDLMVLAMACDLSRVVTLQWSTAESTTVHSQLGISDEHHLMSHDIKNKAPLMTKINTWYADQFAYLLTEMKKVKEGSGTLLDNTLLFWPNELSQAEVHSRRNLPYVLAGSAQGKVPTGRYLKYQGDPHNQLLATFMNIFGVDVPSFGESMYPGVLSGIAT